MRFLLTGAGSISLRHARHLRDAVPGCELGVVTRSPSERLAQWPSGTYPVPDLEAGLARQPDAVLVTSASVSHAGEVLRLIAEKLPMYVEKPLATSYEQWALLEPALTQAHAASAFGCNLRFLPALGLLRCALADGIAGHIVRGQVEVGQWLPSWRPQRTLSSSYSAHALQGGGVIYDLVHEVDLAEWMLGPLKVRAALSGRWSSLPIQADDTALALLSGPRVGALCVSMDYVARQPVRRQAYVGDQGTLEFDLLARRLVLRGERDTRVLAEHPADFDVAATYLRALGEWLDALRGKAALRTAALPDAIASTRLMLAIAASASRERQ